MDAGDPPARSCVGSGFCCKVAPCPFGAVDDATGWCTHLIPWPNDDLGVPRYRCGQYAFIQTHPSAEIAPAFGTGCSSTLFNTDRQRVRLALIERGRA